jgi:hypothetical protein
MSRYVQIAVESATLAEVRAALHRLGLAVEVGVDDPVALPPSLECAGELVDLACPAGTLGAVEAFGFRVTAPRAGVSATSSGPGSAAAHDERAGEITLVCGDVDRRRLERELVPKLRFEVAATRVAAAAGARGLAVERDDASALPRLIVRTIARRR